MPQFNTLPSNNLPPAADPSADNSDGFPGNPPGSSLESTGHSRFYPIFNTVDSIRVPEDPFVAGTATLGYRREDATGSGGGSEWLIDWTAIATFTGATLTTLDDAKWHSSTIKTGKIYLGLFDAADAIGNGAVSYICRADLTTGTIEAVTEIQSTNITAVGSANVDTAMDGTNNASVFWDITDAGNLRMLFNTSSSANTTKGVALVELTSDFVTLSVETIFFDYASTFGMDISSFPIAYFTKNLKVFVAGDVNDLRLIVPGNGVISIASSTNDSTLMQTSNLAANLTLLGRGTSTNISNHVNGDSIAIRRHMTNVVTDTNGDRTIPRMEVNRGELDAYLETLVLEYSGVAV